MATKKQEQEDYVFAKQELAARAQRDMVNSYAKDILVGRKKTLMHPLDLLDGLSDFGDFLFETGYTPTLAAMAIHVKISKNVLYAASNDNRRYYYYDIQNHMGTSIAQRAVYAQDDLDDVKHGAEVSLLPFLDIDFLIDDYATVHHTKLVAEDYKKIKAYKSIYIKRLHNLIKSRKHYSDFIVNLHKIWSGKSVYTSDPVRRRRNLNRRLEAINSDASYYKDIYAVCVTGNVIVRTITFSEILEFYKNVAENEWLQLGKTSRNPALSIFLLMNHSGYASAYQNKQVVEYKPTLSVLESEAYDRRLEAVLHPQLETKTGGKT